MSARRHLTRPDGFSYSHIFSPRKQRTYEYTRLTWADGGTWNKNRHYRPSPQSPELKWIGKYFIPMGSRPYNENADNYVMEHDIALWARPNIYQVIYADANGSFISKPDSMWRPGRLNVIVNASDNTIMDISYF